MSNENLLFYTPTIGTVVDTNDPQQMGRIRVLCPSWNDDIENKMENIPFANYMSPFGGIVAEGKRGSDETGQVMGPVAYGMWAIPKVGAEVVVMCIDGNPNLRYWVGCKFPAFTPHTLPHGRFSSQQSKHIPKGSPQGPFDSFEQPILPLYNNLLDAYGTDRDTNFEWKTRGADYSVAAVEAGHIGLTSSRLADDKPVKEPEDDKTPDVTRQGYETSRQRPDQRSSVNDGNFDSQTYSITTPGFHTFSMDDRKKNCRVRLRTTAGNQIILDDTNERIFISTANGKSWIEMDQAGNIDIHSDGRISMHSTKDMNFTTDKSFRVKAKEGIHLQSDTDIRIQSEADVHMRSNTNVRLDAFNAVHVSAFDNIFISGGAVHAKAFGGTLNIEASGNINELAGGQIIQTGSQIHMNGPGAAAATEAAPGDNLYAYATNRVPFNLKPNTDEMWGRTCMDTNKTDNDDISNGVVDFYDRANHEYDYDDENIGYIERGTAIARGPYWRR